MFVHHMQFTQTMAPPPEGLESQQCMQLILKLRWIGLYDEADRLERAARSLAPDDRGTVLADPASTD
jgi:hypothetical protein